jgi:hypothetical protein
MILFTVVVQLVSWVCRKEVVCCAFSNSEDIVVF